MARSIKYIICFIVVTFLYIYAFNKLDRYNGFSGDNLIKLIQAKGLIDSNFQSQNLYYPGIKYDPHYLNFPFQEGATSLLHDEYLNSKGIYIGAFPYLFSLFSAKLINLFGDIKYLGYVNFVFGISVLLFTLLYWRIHYVTFLFIVFCTNFFISSLEYSEILIFLSIHFVGYSIFLKNQSEVNGNLLYLLSGIICGFSMFFRLESILFFVSIIAAHTLQITFIFCRQLLKEQKMTFQEFRKSSEFNEELNYFKKIIFHSLGFIFVLIIFFTFNYLSYNSLFGPRFAANESGFIGNISIKLNNIFTLLFFKNGKMGLFGYTPIMIILLSYLLISKKDYQIKYVFLFIILVSFLTPSDGFANWGPRFYSLTILSFALIFDDFYKNIFLNLNKVVKVLFFIALLYSISVTFLGFKILMNSSKQVKMIQSNLLEVESDIWVFDSLQLAHYSGHHYFDKIIYVPNNTDSMNKTLIEIDNEKKLKTNRIIYFKSIIPEQYLGMIVPKINSTELESFLNSKLKVVSKKKFIYFEAIVYSL